MNPVKPFHKTEHGAIILGDSMEYMAGLHPGSLDLIVTSPSFGLVRKKGLRECGKPGLCRVVQAVRGAIHASTQAIRIARNRYRWSMDARTADSEVYV